MADSITQWGKLAHLTAFDGAFAFVVDQNGALLGLFGRVVADLDQSLDDVVKGVDVIIEHDQIMDLLLFDHKSIFQLVLREGVGKGHGQIHS